jgi:hypothetical protein
LNQGAFGQLLKEFPRDAFLDSVWMQWNSGWYTNQGLNFLRTPMNRRTLLKYLALIPLVTPAAAKAASKSTFKPPIPRRPYLPAFFPKWNKSTDGLEDPGNWAVSIERSFLPLNIRFPRVGEVWVAVRDCLVSFGARWDLRTLEPTEATSLLKQFGPSLVQAGPHRVIIGGTGSLDQGEKIRVLSLDDSEKPLLVGFQAQRHEELEARIVPQEVRKTPGYLGYELSLRTARSPADLRSKDPLAYFNEAFRFVENAA